MISNAERLRVWRAANPGKFKQQLKNYREKHKEAIKTYKARYNQDNAERIRQQKAEWHERNKERVKEQQRAWRQANKLSILERNAKRRAIKLSRTVGDIDLGVLTANMQCGICGGVIEDSYHIDHIIPLARGGAHTQSNLQLAHPICNLKKKDKLPDDFTITTN